MELKLISGSVSVLVDTLLIRPEWNWNKDITSKLAPAFGVLLIRPEWNWNMKIKQIMTNGAGLLIRPEWNWNSNIWKTRLAVPLPFNQTRMELKLENAQLGLSVPIPFNQTRMELKLSTRADSKVANSVLLIRPEWNWNRAADDDDNSPITLLIRPEWNWNLPCEEIP